MKNGKGIMMLVMFLVIGFASVSTALILNGKLVIGFNEDNWDVKFIEAQIDKGIVNISSDGKSITFETSNLINVGESSILSYKIKNNSTQYKANTVVKCSNNVSDYISIDSVLNGVILSDVETNISINPQEVLNGKITSTLIKSATVDNQSISIKCEIVSSPVENDMSIDYAVISNKEVFYSSMKKIMNIISPTENSGTQQSIATDGEKFYVLYPSDSGYQGVIQEYDIDGNVTNTYNNMNLSHASNTAYYNGFLYVLGTKKRSKNLEIYKVNVSDGTQETIYLEMSKSMIWDGLSIYDNKIYCVGVDQNGNVDRKTKPNEAVLDVVDIITLKSESSIKINIPDKTWYTCQGLAVYENYAYALVSPTNSSGEFVNGFNVYKINIKTGNVTDIEIPASTFSEPEGAAIYKYNNNIYVVSSLVNKGGIYTVAKIVETFEENDTLPNLVNGDIPLTIGKTLQSDGVSIGDVIDWTNDRMVMENIYTLEAKDKITLLPSDEYLYNIYFYDNNLNYNEKTSYISEGEFSFNEDRNYRLIVKPKESKELLESDIENIKKYIAFDINFTIGKTLDSTGSDTGSIGNVIDWTNDRMVTEELHLSNSKIAVSVKDGFQINAYYYSKDGSYKSKTGFVDECIIPSDTLYRIIVKSIDSNYEFTELDSETLVNFN